MLAKIANLRFNTVVGKKIVMALTGLAMCLFLVGHLAGNLLLVWGKDKFNGYAAFLTPLPLIPIIELGLLAILLFHVLDAFALLRLNYNARPVPYHSKTWARTKSKKSKKTWASTFMMWSGMIILFFIIFHVWHFKYHHPIASAPIGDGHNSSVVVGVAGAAIGASGGTTGENSGKEAYDLAQLVVNELSNPLVAGIYILSMAALGLHLYHAVSSAFTSLGANHPRYQKGLMWVGNIFTLVVCGGFTLIPFLILIKVVK
ncbi:succinate dehydrogenase / fumarate reductase cytochrome b subunit [Abditibacterium utsteinense]|uniref:Succinate dehydrogenase / fumarate reductase cytochrome b subunit n=1 Tax=Abditibacterium utsteinense TaxID=1960156 RepID=A0A2S8SW82_9BACT|nr:succinate dehydrogenase cytochrome b subunit [Abditibacterium utsteinense]PQV65056.1 succinate dehydrogenase / fumarate reductase cytochrome b subunit [Abditibacterium utsteinense]